MDGGETDSADLEPGSAWKTLNAPSLLPKALAFEAAKPRTALKSFSDRPGPRSSIPGREPGGPGGPGRWGCGSPEPSLTCGHGCPLPEGISLFPTFLQEKPQDFLPALPLASHGTSGRSLNPSRLHPQCEVAQGLASTLWLHAHSGPLLHLAGRPPGRIAPSDQFGAADQHFPVFEPRIFYYLCLKVILEISKYTLTSKEEW